MKDSTNRQPKTPAFSLALFPRKFPHLFLLVGLIAAITVRDAVAAPPSAVTNSATNITSSGAVFHGTINPNGLTTNVYFEYGPTTSYGSFTPSANFTGTSSIQVQSTLSGANPNTTFHYRVVAGSSGGAAYGNDVSFTTLGNAPSATTNAATNVGSGSATLNGTVNPNGGATTAYFQFGLSTNYGATTSSSNVGSGTSSVSFHADTGAIQPNQTFHYRAVATNNNGTTYGQDLTFVTSAMAPSATTNAATSVTSTSAQVNATVNPNGSTTSVYFQYGLTSSYGSQNTPANFTGTSPLPILAQMSGLNPSTTYHYRVVASNNGGTTYGGDVSFTTSGSAPTATTNAATNITSSSATLNGTVNPNGGATTAYFQFGLSTNYGATTSSSNVGSGTSNVSFQASTGAIQPGQTFHYRLVATNATGTTYGNDLTFMTLNDAPYALTNAASSIESNSFQGNATVNPNGLSTTVYFQYGLTTNYGASNPPGTFAGNANLSVFATLSTNIQPGATYHYRVVASSSAGTTYGNDVVVTTSGAPTPSPTPTVSPTPTATASSTPTATPTGTPTATPSPVQVFLSLHSLRTDAISNVSGAGVDDPLLPMPDETRLAASQPSADKGLVADGVTPLIIQIDSLSAPAQPTTFNITTSVDGGSLRTGALDQNLNTLHHPADGAPNFSVGGAIVLSPNHPTGFAYISAIKCEDLDLPIVNIQHDMDVTLTIRQSDYPSNVKQISFKIRKPPVVLVHGFNSDRRTWSPEFLSALASSRHTPCDPSNPSCQLLPQSDNFVVPINYGVDANSNDPDFRNRVGSLESLASELDAVLSSQIETRAIAGVGTVGTYKNWAMTRYDLVCQSQGGVLVRMLCAVDPSQFQLSTPFRNANNANRGRFRRIVTIGSPQNGTTLEYYLRRLSESFHDLREFYAMTQIMGLLQDKFDPFGSSIRHLNEVPVNPDAKFYLLCGLTVNSPKIFDYFYLNSETVRMAVIPNGSDGVVDFDSQIGGQIRPFYRTIGATVTHATGHEDVFGVPPGSTETGLGEVAQEAVTAFDGSPDIFAGFRLPTVLTAERRQAIDAIIPGTRSANLIASIPMNSLQRSASVMQEEVAAELFQLKATPEIGEPLGGEVTWISQVLGPNGATTNSTLISVDSQDSTNATLTVGSDVYGDVIVYASYPSSSGNLIVGVPVVAFSRPVGPNLIGISIEPSSMAVSVGDQFTVQFWGRYDNGAIARLYESANQPAQYTVADNSIISIGAGNQLTARGVGETTISVTFKGFSAQAAVTSKTLAGPQIGQLANISTRLNVGAGDDALIGGFVISGTQSKNVVVRGIGPSLPLAGRLENPTLELRDSSGALLDSNDNWVDSPNKQALIDSTVQPTSDLEAAIIATLPANGSTYTAILRGAHDGIGTGVIEVYDLDQSADSKLANISSRGFVDTGDNVMIGGMIITGGVSTNVLVRAMGPSLASAGVSNALQDPTLELHDGNGTVIAFNDNWRDSQESQIIGTSIPPRNDRESAILTMLPPGAYTAIVRGKDNSVGVGLVEAYQLGN